MQQCIIVAVNIKKSLLSILVPIYRLQKSRLLFIYLFILVFVLPAFWLSLCMFAFSLSVFIKRVWQKLSFRMIFEKVVLINNVRVYSSFWSPSMGATKTCISFRTSRVKVGLDWCRMVLFAFLFFQLQRQLRSIARSHTKHCKRASDAVSSHSKCAQTWKDSPTATENSSLTISSVPKRMPTAERHAIPWIWKLLTMR